jgi:hypothetical protein
MYFDLQLWSLTRGLRGRIALGVLLGLLSLCVGIARFVFLGALLVRVLNGATLDEAGRLPASRPRSFCALLWNISARSSPIERLRASRPTCVPASSTRSCPSAPPGSPAIAPAG